MKVVFFEAREYEREFFQRELKDLELEFYPYPLTEESVDKAANAQVVSVRVLSRLDKDLLSKLKGCRLIATRSTGYDHIDVEYARKLGIAVCNVPAYGSGSVAEHTVALMLALSRRLIESIERTRKGIFDFEGLTGFNLLGKTLGVIGAGNIGRKVIKIALAFGMKVLAYDIRRDEELAKTLGFEYVDLDYLLQNSDIISLHANLTKENYHMLDEEAFSKMKDGVIIVNTARGGLIDTKALIKNLLSGKVKACALDVLEDEYTLRYEKELLLKENLEEDKLKTLAMNHVLLKLQHEGRLIITPHNAFNSYESLQEVLRTTLMNILSFLEGKPINLVQ
ncbi:NAD(P)-dependent oxidoreductase [Thermocrinis minervae]|uniref:D-lactate dehydrogenase n=1 Tax=Thermocrinis minervae TaxID=381751 RepID=A0A1M6QPR2_9AQUI|nr:NAD(P)-dependent oxidoreductase [Thermocrinis minervae]SHK22282.1 D-lactate dehydrogenase [Thermocrinis minervae]